MDNLKELTLRDDIRQIYYSEMAGHFFRTGNSAAAQLYLEKAFLLDPDNLEIQSGLIEIVSRQLSYKPLWEVFQSALDYYDTYETLRKNNAFVAMVVSIALTRASQNFDLGRPGEAIKYLEEFERIYREGIEVLTYLIVDTYTSATVYYFGKGNKSLARSYIEKGLKFSPDNYQLLQLQKSF